MRRNSEDAVRELGPYVDNTAVYGHGPRLDDFTDGEQVGGVAARVPPAASGARAAEPSTACAR
jgi:hypothetical protein